MGTAERDFALFDANELYHRRRAELAADKSGGRDASTGAPRTSRSERALVYVLQKMGKPLGNIGTGRLRNLFSVFRDIPAEWETLDCPVEHEELEATCPPQRTKANFRECSDRLDGVQPKGKPEDAK
jgi:hypothetical protein